MHPGERLDDIITRHFCNELNKEEQALLLQWLQASESNRQYYEALKNTWQLMKAHTTPHEMDAGNEWAYFQDCLQQDARGERDYTGLLQEKRSKIRRLLLPAAVAAAILVLMVAGYYWLGNNKVTPVTTAKVEEKKVEPVLLRHAINTTKLSKRFLLPDSSVVLLEPQSEISWHEPFMNNRREVQLKGRARFTVAKDSHKPFTVISAQLATTALGTQFMVTAFEKEPLITVQLYEGRVVVKAADSIYPKLKSDFYLLPGEELVYSNEKHTASVHRFGNGSNTAKGKPQEHLTDDQPLLPVGDKGNWYMFNNQPLTQVFMQLQEMYGAPIEYQAADIEKMYFIGKFSKTDSVAHILQQIAVLNNLTVTKQGNRYIISK